jgi:hypothetical protein
MTLTIVLSGSPDGYRQVAECKGITVTKAKGGVIHELARKLQTAGHDPETIVHVVREGTRVFAPCKLRQWADFMLYENDERGGFRLVRWNYEAAAMLTQERRANP